MTGLIKTLKMLYPPTREESVLQTPKGLIVLNLCFIGVGNGSGGFKIHLIIDLFETLKMFYPPKGGCEAYRERVHKDNWF